MRSSFMSFFGVMCVVACTSVGEPLPFGVIPSRQQVEWHQMEYNMFVHFGPNTFTGSEWGSGKEKAELFNPEDMDCRQWTSIAKAAGMNGVIITAKHHDGFCLWPNPMSHHTVAQSSWRNGEGDVLKELSEACSEDDLGFGVYISPWDRNDPIIDRFTAGCIKEKEERPFDFSSVVSGCGGRDSNSHRITPTTPSK